MISLEQIGRKKTQAAKPAAANVPAYDHATQQRWGNEFLGARRVHMKSATSWDGESDQSDERR
jgi:hypothetical protein